MIACEKTPSTIRRRGEMVVVQIVEATADAGRGHIPLLKPKS
jgi:hypothetical protein